MERLLTSPGRRRDMDHRYHTARPSSQQLSRASVSFASAATLNRSNGTLRNEFGAEGKPGDTLDFSSQFYGGLPLRKMNEKELLHGLNDRFAGFIEKVHHLENQNNMLEKEIEDIRLKAKSSASLTQEYEYELNDLRKQVHDIALQKHQIEMEQNNLEDEFNILRNKCEEEVRCRSEVESTITVLKKYISDAYLAKQQMERKAKSVADEVEFLKRNHEAEVAEMMAQIQETRVTVEKSDFGKGNLTAALRDIRMQLEGHAATDIRHAEEHFRAQVAKLTKTAEVNRDALMATRAEICENRRQLQSRSVDLDSWKGRREALERELHDLEQRHNAEIHHYQDTIRELQMELNNTKYDMSGHLREYQDLLNVKMALDAEIFSYRKLLEGEESRYSTISDNNVSVPYIYRQSPVYTLPCVTRQGAITRKPEPQYKFVEEIITETTREDVEISDTGSDEAPGEEDEVEMVRNKDEEDDDKPAQVAKEEDTEESEGLQTKPERTPKETGEKVGSINEDTTDVTDVQKEVETTTEKTQSQKSPDAAMPERDEDKLKDISIKSKSDTPGKEEEIDEVEKPRVSAVNQKVMQKVETVTKDSEKGLNEMDDKQTTETKSDDTETKKTTAAEQVKAAEKPQEIPPAKPAASLADASSVKAVVDSASPHAAQPAEDVPQKEGRKEERKGSGSPESPKPTQEQAPSRKSEELKDVTDATVKGPKKTEESIKAELPQAPKEESKKAGKERDVEKDTDENTKAKEAEKQTEKEHEKQVSKTTEKETQPEKTEKKVTENLGKESKEEVLKITPSVKTSPTSKEPKAEQSIDPSPKMSAAKDEKEQKKQFDMEGKSEREVPKVAENGLSSKDEVKDDKAKSSQEKKSETINKPAGTKTSA